MQTRTLISIGFIADLLMTMGCLGYSMITRDGFIGFVAVVMGAFIGAALIIGHQEADNR